MDVRAGKGTDGYIAQCVYEARNACPALKTAPDEDHYLKDVKEFFQRRDERHEKLGAALSSVGPGLGAKNVEDLETKLSIMLPTEYRHALLNWDLPILMTPSKYAEWKWPFSKGVVVRQTAPKRRKRIKLQDKDAELCFGELWKCPSNQKILSGQSIFAGSVGVERLVNTGLPGAEIRLVLRGPQRGSLWVVTCFHHVAVVPLQEAPYVKQDYPYIGDVETCYTLLDLLERFVAYQPEEIPVSNIKTDEAATTMSQYT